MNKAILDPEVQEFITANEKADLTRLILSGSPFDHITAQEIAQQIFGKKKAKNKLPEWYENAVFYPPKINLEQCSSSATARLKSTFAKGKSLIDLTGGFGVDDYFFSKQFSEVTYCEINPELYEITQHNLQSLGVKNITFHQGDGMQYIAQGEKNYDVIYLDPSRRNDSKGKVFMLADCEPNLPENLDLLLSKAKNILVKASPILDISNALNELDHVKKVIIVALNNEVKELLFLINKEAAELSIETYNITNSEVEELHLNYTEASLANARFELPQAYLYEPNAALMKSGMFNAIGNAFNLNKLHQNSHLYTSESLIEFPGRRFKITEVVPFSAKAISKKLKQQKANITTRNFKQSVDQLRKKFKVKDGGDLYVFFTTDMNNASVVLFCEKV